MNDLQSDAMSGAVAASNAAGAIGSIGAGLVGMRRPMLLMRTTGDVSSAVDFYANLYGVRAIPLGAALLALLR
ncbi:hypothetical protein [Antrihabitans cavernicola]|uniref:Uncharacterized protein n=1 Tax=Antrihabitans cavernicola TaxID=2495913 RepID=A0A5A7SHC4_9NOCA|nr:hypothetical protein [Spelaeibacter cavernicola]KAA0024809.1 hypothetical protein FOY51_02430 [Spelaeibacter cavernicola]